MTSARPGGIHMSGAGQRWRALSVASLVLSVACGVWGGPQPPASAGDDGQNGVDEGPASTDAGAAEASAAQDEQPAAPGSEAPGALQLNASGPVESSDLAVSGTHVYVAWVEQLPDGASVHFRRSEDEGATFASLQPLTEPTVGIHSARVVASGSDVYVLWAQVPARANPTVWVRESSDAGATFGPAQPVPLGSILDVTAEGTSLYVLSQVAGAGDELADFHFVASQDRGATWGPVQTLNRDGRYGGASLLSRGERVYLLWDDGGTNDDPTLFFRESADRGVTFGPILKPAEGARGVRSEKMLLQGARLHIVWSRCAGFHVTGTCQAALRTQPDVGHPFGPVEVLSSNNVRALAPDIAVDGDALHVVWVEGAAARSDLVYRRSVDAGRTFHPEQRLTKTPALRIHPQVAAGGAFVFFDWQLDTTVYFRQAGAYGSTFTDVELLSAGLNVRSPEVAATPHHFHTLRVEGDYDARVLKYWRR